jgi:hypothetical protein
MEDLRVLRKDADMDLKREKSLAWKLTLKGAA